MANNRMFLVYRPTGDAVYLGKRMAIGWYDTPKNVAQKIMELFEKAEQAVLCKEFLPDDFAIALESGENNPHAITKWTYAQSSDDKNVIKLVIDEI